MANTFIFPEIYSKEYQVNWLKKNVSEAICNWNMRKEFLEAGQTFSRVYATLTEDVYTYSRGTDMTAEDVTDAKETLTVNREFYKAIYIDNYDKIQDNKDAAVKYGELMSTYLKNQSDADVLGEVFNAETTIDDGDLGGTDGNGISLSTSNLGKVVALVRKALRKKNVDLDLSKGIVSPEWEQVLTEYLSGRDTAMGDEVSRNGFIGKYLGVEHHVSNQTAASAVLALATDVTATDTVTINGVVFTYVASIGTTPGNVLKGANADADRVNLTAAINGSAGAGTTYIEVSAANRRKLRNITATNDASANTMLVKHKGAGVISVDEALTDTTDGWTKKKQHLFFGRKGCVEGIMQAFPKILFTQPELRNGKYLLNTTLYGVKTYSDGDPAMANVEIDATDY